MSKYSEVIDDLVNYTYRNKEYLLAQDIIEESSEYAEALANELNAQLALREDTVTLATELFKPTNIKEEEEYW